MAIDKAHAAAVRAATKTIMDYAALKVDGSADGTRDHRLNEAELGPVVEKIIDRFQGNTRAAPGGGKFGPEQERIEMALLEAIKAVPDAVKLKNPGTIPLSDLRRTVRARVEEQMNLVLSATSFDDATKAMAAIAMLPDVAIRHLQKVTDS